MITNDSKEYISGAVRLETKEFNLEFSSRKIEKPYSVYIIDIEAGDNGMMGKVSYPTLEIEVPKPIQIMLSSEINSTIEINIFNDENNYWVLSNCTVLDTTINDNGRTSIFVSMDGISFVGGGQSLMDIINEGKNDE